MPSIHVLFARDTPLRRAAQILVLLGLPAAHLTEAGRMWTPATLHGALLALAGLPVVGVWRWLSRGLAPVADPGAAASPALPPPTLTGGRALAAGLVNGVALLGVVWTLKSTDLAWADFSRTGAANILHTACRALLALELWLACCTVGALALRRLAPGVATGAGPWPLTLLAFFAGAALYGLAATLLGLFGLLGLGSALILVAPAVVAAPRVVAGTAALARQRVCAYLRGASGLEAWLRGWLLWCAAVAWGLLGMTRGLYPGQTASDVWQHYLHYYRAVLDSGSLGPNEVWYHFHVSKGAGLFYLAGALSDALAPQLVSWCFITMAGVAAYLILRRLTGDPAWGLLGIAVLWATYRGDFFKHHDPLAGFVALFLWLAVELGTRGDAANAQATRRALAATGILCGLYVGFYLPVGSSLLVAFWGLLAMLSLAVPAWRATLRPALGIVVALGAGVVATLAVNYAATGIAEVVPIALFWSFADRARFAQEIGTTGIAYLLHTEASRFESPVPLAYWLRQTVRYHHLRVLFPPAMVGLGALAAAVALWRRRPSAAQLRPYAVLAAFAAPALALAVAVRNPSVPRLFAFSTILTSLLLVALTWGIVVVLSSGGVRRWARLSVTGLLALYAVAQVFWYGSYSWGVTMPTVTAYLGGRISFGEVMLATESVFAPKVSLTTIVRMRKPLPPATRIVDLGNNPGPGCAFPGAGLTGGINHTLGGAHTDAIFGRPDRARQVLARHGWNHFLVDLRSAPANALAHSRLFQPGPLAQHLRVAFREGDTYLLTWRDPGDTEPLPARLRQVLELLQTGALRYPASAAFDERADELLARRIRRATPFDPAATGREVVALLRAGLPPLRVPENRAFVDGLLRTTERSIVSQAAALDRAIRKHGLETTNPADRVDAYRERFGQLLKRSFRVIITERCTAELGAEITEALTRGGAPLAPIYASRAAFDEILGLEPP